MSLPPKRNHLFFFCIVLLCRSFYSFTQDNSLKFERYTTENGLPSNVIYSILQDSKGYLWLATNEGLSRYDGYHFKNFRHHAADTNSIAGNQVAYVFEDSSGTIWSGTHGGLSRYNAAKNNFSTIRHAFANNIIQVSKNELMIRNSVEAYTLNTQTFDKKKVFKEDGHRIYNTMTSREGDLYFLISNHWSESGKKGYLNNFIYKYDKTSKSLNDPLKLSFVSHAKDEAVMSYFIDSRNNCWAGTQSNGRIYRWNNQRNERNIQKAELIKKDLQAVKSIFEDNTGQIWFVTTKGVFCYQYETGELKLILDQPANFIFQDKTGVIWIGTYNGLYKLNSPRYMFRHLTASETAEPRLLNDFVLGIRELPDKKIFIRYYWGEPRFSLLDPSLRSIKHYAIKDFSFIDYIRKFEVRNMKQLNEDSLKKLIRSIFYNIKNFGENSFLLSDAKQQLWLIIEDLKLLDSIQSFRAKFEPNISDAAVFDNEIWLTSNAFGLWSINTSTLNIRKYQAAAEDETSISANTLNCLLIEKNGNIWIGTKGTGLDYFVRSKNIFLHYTMEDGLPNNSIFSLVMDDKGRLWIGTGNGLSVFDTTTKKFTNFHRTDGLVNSEFNRFSACKLSSGHILMGGMSGIDLFHPDSLMKSFVMPQVQIIDFRVFNRSVFPADNLTLSYFNNYITIDFAAMDYRNPSANRYAYMLKGIDKDWVMAGNQPSVSYATLSPGRYHFLVKAAGSDGIWNETPAEIIFSIKTPWWRTWGFFAGIGIFIFTVFYIIYRFRIYQLKKVFAVRTKISQDLHDEVGATLTSISFLSEVAKQQKGNGNEYAYESIDKIGEFSREMIGEMNDIVWAINPANDKFEKIEDRMFNFATTLLATKNIQLNFRSNADIRNLALGMQQRKNLYLIFKEAVNNAAKYSDCTELTVNVTKEDHHIHLEIIDNGKGFVPENAENKSGGNGLKNMQSRAVEVNAKFFMNSQPGKGTHISLSMPITQNAY